MLTEEQNTPTTGHPESRWKENLGGTTLQFDSVAKTRGISESSFNSRKSSHLKKDVPTNKTVSYLQTELIRNRKLLANSENALATEKESSLSKEEALRQRLNTLEHTHDTIKTENQKLKQLLKGKETAFTQEEVLSRWCPTCQPTAKRAHKTLRKTFEKDLQKEKEKMGQTKIDLERQFTREQKELEKKAKAKADKKAKEIAGMQKRMNDKLEEAHRLRREEEGRCAKLKSLLSAAQQETVRVRHDEDTLKRRIKTYQDQISGYDAKHKKALKKVEDRLGDNTAQQKKSRQEIRSLKHANDRHLKEVKKAHAREGALKAQIEETKLLHKQNLRKVKQEKDEEVKRSKSLVNKLVKEVDAITERYQKSQQQLTSLTTAKEKQKRRVMEEKEKYSVVEQKLEELRESAASELQQTKTHYERELMELEEDKNRELKEQIEDKEDALAQVQQYKRELEIREDEHKGQLEMVRERERSKFEKSICDLQARVADEQIKRQGVESEFARQSACYEKEHAEDLEQIRLLRVDCQTRAAELVRLSEDAEIQRGKLAEEVYQVNKEKVVLEERVKTLSTKATKYRRRIRFLKMAVQLQAKLEKLRAARAKAAWDVLREKEVKKSEELVVSLRAEVQAQLEKQSMIIETHRSELVELQDAHESSRKKYQREREDLIRRHKEEMFNGECQREAHVKEALEKALEENKNHQRTLDQNQQLEAALQQMRIDNSKREEMGADKVRQMERLRSEEKVKYAEQIAELEGTIAGISAAGQETGQELQEKQSQLEQLLEMSEHQEQTFKEELHGLKTTLQRYEKREKELIAKQKKAEKQTGNDIANFENVKQKLSQENRELVKKCSELDAKANLREKQFNIEKIKLTEKVKKEWNRDFEKKVKQIQAKTTENIESSMRKEFEDVNNERKRLAKECKDLTKICSDFEKKIILRAKQHNVEKKKLVDQTKRQLNSQMDGKVKTAQEKIAQEVTRKLRKEFQVKIDALRDQHSKELESLRKKLEKQGEMPVVQDSAQLKLSQLVKEEVAKVQDALPCVLPLKETGTAGMYTFGVRKIHLCIVGGRLSVRVGGGYLTFQDFVKKFGKTEARKMRKEVMRKKAKAQPKQSATPLGTKTRYINYMSYSTPKKDGVLRKDSSLLKKKHQSAGIGGRSATRRRGHSSPPSSRRRDVNALGSRRSKK